MRRVGSTAPGQQSSVPLAPRPFPHLQLLQELLVPQAFQPPLPAASCSPRSHFHNTKPDGSPKQIDPQQPLQHFIDKIPELL